MAASLIEPIKSTQQAAVVAATALANEGRSGDDERQRVTFAHCVQLGAAFTRKLNKMLVQLILSNDVSSMASTKKFRILVFGSFRNKKLQLKAFHPI